LFCRSEANDLALRIARQHADSDDVITVDRYTILCEIISWKNLL